MAELARPAPAAVPAALPWRAWAWPLLLLAVALCGLDRYPLFDVDEGAFGEASRELLASGDWGHTTLNGLDRFDKPIGIYWLQALCLQLLGASEFALRLPSALAATAWALALGRFAREQGEALDGLRVGGLVITSLGVVAMGRAATADAALNLLITLAGLDLWRAVSGRRRAPLRRAALWIGLGLLVKGPVALLVPGAAVLLWAATRPRQAPWRWLLNDGWSWLILGGVAVPWYAYALWRHGMAFVDGFLLHHNLERFSSAMEGHHGLPGYYLLVLPLLLLPGTPLMLRVLGQLRHTWGDPLGRYLLCWAGFVLVFFSLSGTQLPHYALYGASPWLLLMGRALGRVSGRWLAALWVSLALWLGLLALGPAGLPWWQGQVREPLYQALLAGAPPLPAGALAALLLTPVALALVLRRLALPADLAWLSAALATTVLAALTVLPWWGRTLQGPVPRLATLARETGEPVVQWRLHQPSFAFYLGRPVPRAEPAPGELALTRLDRLSPDAPVQVLADDRGLALVRRLPAHPTATAGDAR